MSSAQPQQQTVLITGAARGIGLGLVEAYAKAGFRVIAAARTPNKADQLNALAKANKSISIVALDVSDSKSVGNLHSALTGGVSVIPKLESLDILINNAGIASTPSTAAVGFTKLEQETVSNFVDIYRTNVVGVWEVAQSVLPLLRKSKLPQIINISSLMGSVEDTNSSQLFAGRSVAYRASKAALNELSAVQAREYNPAIDAKAPVAPTPPVIGVLVVHPGWVDTDMGNSAGIKPPTSLPQSITGIHKVITAAAAKPSPKAVFIDFEGKLLPW